MATAPLAAAAPEPAPALDPISRPSRAKVGMMCLILAEISFFGVFVVAYLFYIGKSATGPQPSEVLSFPTLATIALLSSSGTIVLSTRALARQANSAFVGAMLATIALGALFLGLTALEWRELIDVHRLTIRTNLFGTTFYSLVGFHAAHVFAGLCLLSGIAIFGALGAVRPAHAEKVEMVSWYWHFVDVVWVVVLTVVYVVGVQA